jgi:molecular chaperone GrpE (heat shock protein)/DNA-binding Xre family transcriptional regulator
MKDRDIEIDNVKLLCQNRTLKLKDLMHRSGIDSFRQLYRSTQTSAQTIDKIRSGEIATLRWQTIVKISNIFQISAIDFIEMFGGRSLQLTTTNNDRQLAQLQQEYDRLQQQLQQQREILQTEFQSQSLQTLESFLTYFPTAKQAALNNPDFSATKLLPLVGSIDRLIAGWDVKTIGAIGTEIPYDPQYHQLVEGTANPGDLVTVRYIGYHHRDRLLFRAKVAKIQP